MIRKYFSLYACLGLVISASAQNNLPDDWPAPRWPSTFASYSLPGGYGALNASGAKFNYVRTYAPFTRLTDINSSTVLNKVLVNTTYLNGWGQPIEAIRRGSVGAGDLATPIDQRTA